MAIEAEYGVDEIGFFVPTAPNGGDPYGSVGYMVAGIKQLEEVKVGDTMAMPSTQRKTVIVLQEVKPMVFGVHTQLIPTTLKS